MSAIVAQGAIKINADLTVWEIVYFVKSSLTVCDLCEVDGGQHRVWNEMYNTDIAFRTSIERYYFFRQTTKKSQTKMSK